VPLNRKFFVFFVENTMFRRILKRLFLKSYANGRGSNPPNPLLGTPLSCVGVGGVYWALKTSLILDDNLN